MIDMINAAIETVASRPGDTLLALGVLLLIVSNLPSIDQ